MSQELSATSTKKSGGTKRPREPAGKDAPKYYDDTTPMKTVWEKAKHPPGTILFDHVEGKGTTFTCLICKSTTHIRNDSPTFGTVKKHLDHPSHKAHWKIYRRTVLGLGGDGGGFSNQEPTVVDEDETRRPSSNNNVAPPPPVIANNNNNVPPPPPSPANVRFQDQYDEYYSKGFKAGFKVGIGMKK
jgi:hypothetical protein